MEAYEIELIEKHSVQDNELSSLWALHRDYERQLDKLLKKPALSPAEEADMKDLKKKKLAGKTRLIQLLEKYKAEA